MLPKSVISKTLMPAIVFTAIVLITATCGIVSEVALLQRGASPLTVFLFVNALTGAVGAVGYLQHQAHKAQRLRAVDENLQMIRDMNHEVRNVLGIVAFYGKQTSNDYVLKVFENGFKRMDFIMREVLNRGTLLQSQAPPPELPVHPPFRVWGELGRRFNQARDSVRAVGS